MGFISFRKFKKKNIFIFASILLSYFMFQSEYYSDFFYSCKNLNSPNLFSLYFSFMFLGCFIFGGNYYFLFERNEKQIPKSNKQDKAQKENNGKKSLTSELLYNEEQKEIYVPIKYFIASAFLELLSNFFSYSIVFDFIDIESKMLLDGFVIIFIKVFGKFIFKHELYKHQIISMIILLCLLIMGIAIRERYLENIIFNSSSINNGVHDYIQKVYILKDNSNAIIIYLIFAISGNISSAFSICFDNWLMTQKLCTPFKLLFFKGLFGFIPSFSIQIFSFIMLGERRRMFDQNGETQGEINIIELLKRISFPISSFKSIINVFIIILYFILVSFYQISIITTNNKFQPEFVGFVVLIASGLSIITNESVNIYFFGNKRIYYLIPLTYFIISLIAALIICEVIILRFCNCDKYTNTNIDKRGTLEADESFSKYIEDQFKDEKVGIDDLSNDSQENSGL